MCITLCKPKRARIKDGRMITIRRPKMSDVKQFTKYINSLVDEDAMIKINERQTLKSETAWLKGVLSDIRKNKKHSLLAECEGELISMVELRKGFGRQSHVASIGMGVKKNYRRLGVATRMMKEILDIGRKDKDVKIIYLDVYAYNRPAIKLYKRLGFKKVAKLKNRVQHKGKLGDQLIMDYKR